MTIKKNIICISYCALVAGLFLTIIFPMIFGAGTTTVGKSEIEGIPSYSTVIYKESDVGKGNVISYTSGIKMKTERIVDVSNNTMTVLSDAGEYGDAKNINSESIKGKVIYFVPMTGLAGKYGIPIMLCLMTAIVLAAGIYTDSFAEQKIKGAR